MHRFSDIRLVQWLWKTCYQSLKVIRTDTYRSATYDFLLTFLGKYRPISYCFEHKRLFQCTIANSPVYFAPPMKGSYLNWVTALAGGSKSTIIQLPGPDRCLMISSAVYIQYSIRMWRTDGRTDSHRPTTETAITHGVAQ